MLYYIYIERERVREREREKEREREREIERGRERVGERESPAPKSPEGCHRERGKLIKICTGECGLRFEGWGSGVKGVDFGV